MASTAASRGQPFHDGGPAVIPNQKYTAIADTAAHDIVTGTPPTGAKQVVYDLVLSASVDTVVTIQDDALTPNVLMTIDVTASTPVQITPRYGLRLAAINQKVQAIQTGSGTLRVLASYLEETA
jgi:hypothetical protein